MARRGTRLFGRCEPLRSGVSPAFETGEGLRQLVRICPGSAGRTACLSIKRIPEVLVPLPPLAEQRRVVARIEELAAQIHEARTLRQQAAEEAEALSLRITLSRRGHRAARFKASKVTPWRSDKSHFWRNSFA